MSGNLVQQQFGKHAQAYATSHVHAKGASLQRVVALVQPQPSWHVLDIATGAGHTAFVFAPHVASVVATDITPEMLAVTAQGAEERSLANIRTEYADAAHLPFPDAAFNLVTCRIAAHHFPDIPRFLQEVARVLAPNGVFALVDNIVPDGAAGEAINKIEKLRDPSHERCLAVAEWEGALIAAGFDVTAAEVAPKAMEFDGWADRMGASPTTVEILRTLLRTATGEAAAFFNVREEATEDGSALWFNLQEAIIVGRHANSQPGSAG
jgi:ubiquinone/menaquinone biosynthesis C-methylase UbiE